MIKKTTHPLIRRIETLPDKLTPKGRLISEYLLDHSRKAVFMTARELAKACDISEATVVRFVAQLGFSGYSEMQQMLRDYVDTALTLLDRRDLLSQRGDGVEGFRKTVAEEIENLTYLYQTMQLDNLEQAVRMLCEKSYVYVVGSRLSYTIAYYMGWSLTKVRKNIRILKGSDSTIFDWLTIAPEGSLVVVVATSRYPNELVRVGRWARRKNMELMVITDGSSCPVIPFSQLSLVVPSKHIPFLGSPTSLSCLINYLVHEVANHLGNSVKEHQEEIEQTYLENDLLFNPTHER
ncbi:MAG: MurR/RpiR family transcriptional regulator [Desulfobacteraceae bacterium]|nr:MurR/RpiR family transcriptional regulator [Desulfobacteraceae bacterium]